MTLTKDGQSRLRRAGEGASAVLVAFVAGLASATPASAATICPAVNGVAYQTCVTSVSLSRTTASISGAASVPLRVSIGIHSDTGVVAGTDPFYNGVGEPHDVVPELSFTITNGVNGTDRIGLTLTSGDAHDGVWTGMLNLTVADAGKLTTTSVSFGGLGQPPMTYQSVPVALRKSVTVTATRVPKIVAGTVHFTPVTVHVNAPYVIKGTVDDARTGDPLPRITVHVRGPNRVCDCFFSDYTATTDSAGRWSVRIPHLRTFGVSVSITGPVNSDGHRTYISQWAGSPGIVGSVTAALSAATARPGDPVLVTGTAAPADGQGIILEKWVSGAWRTVSTTELRASGRFTLPARPTAAGHWEYRVRDYTGNATSAPMFLDVH